MTTIAQEFSMSKYASQEHRFTALIEEIERLRALLAEARRELDTQRREHADWLAMHGREVEDALRRAFAAESEAARVRAALRDLLDVIDVIPGNERVIKMAEVAKYNPAVQRARDVLALPATASKGEEGK